MSLLSKVIRSWRQSTTECSPAFPGNILTTRRMLCNSPSIGHLRRGCTKGTIPEPLWSALRENGITLSRHAIVSTTEPGNIWVIQDGENSRTFSVRQGKTGLDVRNEYDPIVDPWYLNAVGRQGVVWTKYANWDLLGTGGKFVFVIGKDFDGQLTDKVSPRLASAFRSRQITLA